MARLLALLIYAPSAFGFVPTTRCTWSASRGPSSSDVVRGVHLGSSTVRLVRSVTALRAEHDDSNEVSDDDEMMDFLREFQSRQKEVQRSEAQKSYNLRKAACQSGVALVLPDWVRRLDVDYPLVACGSASDDIYLAHLESGKVLATSASTASATDTQEVPKSLPNTSLSQERIDHTIHQLCGQFDGGGTLAVALRGTLLCEARRSGGVHVWRLNPTNGNDGEIGLVSTGFIPSLQDSLVTCMQVTENHLFVGTDDGTVEAYTIDDDAMLPLTLRMQPDMLWKVGCGTSSKCIVMSLSVHAELGCAVLTTDSGTVEILSLEEEDDEERLVRKPIGSFVPPFDGTERRSSNVFPTCATIIKSSTGNEDFTYDKRSQQIQVNKPPSYMLACGANDGGLFVQKIRMDINDEIDREDPLEGTPRLLMPKHFAAVKCIASPAPGLLVSGGLDGTLRLWDTEQRNDKFLYQFVGYKVWLGSLWTDGLRMVTDGADNTVILHDFTEAIDQSKNSKPPEEREEDTDV
jgi:WD40 repeat protein